MTLVIPNPDKLERLKENFIQAGTKSIQVIADFDRTLTRAFVDGQKSATVIAQIRNGKYLTLEYAPKAHALFDHYHPIEIDPNLSHKEKQKPMHDWWTKHFELLVESGLNKKVMAEIVSQRAIQFRTGALKMFDLLHDNEIPLVIMSASVGDMLAMYLEQAGKLSENIYIIANFFEFDKNGQVTGVKEPIIHSRNKTEIAIKDFPAYQAVKNRKNVILLGDDVEDIGMIEGFDYDNIIKIGFLNDNIEANLENYKTNFDLVLTNDTDMSAINNLLEDIL